LIFWRSVRKLGGHIVELALHEVVSQIVEQLGELLACCV